MNELELKNLWRSTNNKLEEQLFIDKINAEEISKLKVQTFLNSMKPIKTFAVIVGFLWVGIGTTILSNIYLNAFTIANKFFLFSATIQVLLTAIALFIYIYQLIEIYQIEIFKPIIQTQEKLAQLRLSTLWSARISFLQLPVWTTFWWNKSMLINWNWLQWTVAVFITLCFTVLAFWLFLNVKYENRNANWFKLIFKGKEWYPLLKSMDLLEQVENHKE
jgi:hypothetical protein